MTPLQLKDGHDDPALRVSLAFKPTKYTQEGQIRLISARECQRGRCTRYPPADRTCNATTVRVSSGSGNNSKSVDATSLTPSQSVGAIATRPRPRRRGRQHRDRHRRTGQTRPAAHRPRGSRDRTQPAAARGRPGRPHVPPTRRCGDSAAGLRSGPAAARSARRRSATIRLPCIAVRGTSSGAGSR